MRFFVRSILLSQEKEGEDKEWELVVVIMLPSNMTDMEKEEERV